MEPSPFRVDKEEIVLKVKVFPKAGGNRITAVRSGELVVRIQAPAEKGQANKELVRYLAKSFAVPKSQVRIISGERSRHKVLRLPRSAQAALEEVL